MPQQNTDAAAQTLQQLLTARQPLAQGSISSGTQIPQPQPIGTPMQQAPGGGAAQGHFADKGEHKRASMNSLAQATQNLVAQVHNAYQARENKQLGQKFSTLVGSQKGMQAADEQIKNAQSVLQQDPGNAQAQEMLQNAQQMKQHNVTVLNQLLDPTTPEGKKNIKLFNKGFGFDDKNADTPERAAAIQSMQKQTQQSTPSTVPGMSMPGAMGTTQQTPATQGPTVTLAGSGLNAGAAGLLSQMPQGIGMSPATQVSAQMVQAGVTPKAATQGQIMANQNTAAKTVTTQEKNTADEKIKQERLGLDDKGTPIPLDKLPVATQAKVANERAGDDLKSAQANLAQARQKAMEDPKSPQNQIALMKASGYSKIAEAMQLRAQVMMLNYQASTYGKGAQGETLPGTINIGGQTMAPRLAAAATRAIQTQAQFIDADGSIDNLMAAAKDMSSSGQALNDPRLVKLMTDPRFGDESSPWFSNQMGGEIGSTLTSQQRDYLIAQKQARENIMAIRKVLGTGVSVASMNAITTTLPGAQTPDFDYAQKQIMAVKGQLGRLKQGVPNLNMPKPPVAPGQMDFSQFPTVP